LRDPFARLVPDRLAEPVGPPVRPWDVAAGGAGEVGPGGTALLPALDPRLWFKARVTGQDPADPTSYSWVELVTDDAAEPDGYSQPGGAASGTHDARDLNRNPYVPAGAVVWMRAADGPEPAGWEFAYPGVGVYVAGGPGPPGPSGGGSGAGPAGTPVPLPGVPPPPFPLPLVPMLVLVVVYPGGSGSGSGSGSGTGPTPGPLWLSTPGGCWYPVDLGDPDCPGGVEGRVLDLDTGAGVPGVTVRLEQPPGTVLDTFTSDAGGGYLFASKPLGDYTVHVIAPPGKQVTDNDRGVSLFASAPSAAGVDFHLAPASGGTVSCCPDPVPLTLYAHLTGCATGVHALTWEGVNSWASASFDFGGVPAVVRMKCTAGTGAVSFRLNLVVAACGLDTDVGPVLSPAPTCAPFAVTFNYTFSGSCGACGASATLTVTVTEAP
jgi:hypothetical protein